ncbi:hypothetical protein B0H19DRAFT_950437 [Mycena capillaripes]|nr:hypothetical protein B0H19DRAFT_950437 [Mycena capillaripes]
MIFVPVELVREIIAYVLVFPAVSLSDEPGTTSKPEWSLISSLSVASKTYRTLALEAWFRKLFTKSPADLVFLRNNLQEAHSWIREIHCVSTHALPDLWDLTAFRRLRTIRLDCPSINYRTFPFLNIPSTVTELELRGMKWPSPYAIHTVAGTFPQLKTLRFGQSKIWCGLCHTCSKVKFADPVPPKIVYREGFGLPVHYARALSSLQHLHTVSIAVPYSRGTHILLNPNEPARDLWAGECDRCIGIMYDDASFRERWIARKRGVSISGSGGLNSEHLYVKPPALDTVEWAFWSSEIGEEVEDGQDDNEQDDNEQDDDEQDGDEQDGDEQDGDEQDDEEQDDDDDDDDERDYYEAANGDAE